MPPTLRGRAGARLIAILRRALAWYTASVQNAFQAVSSSLAEEHKRVSAAIEEAVEPSRHASAAVPDLTPAAEARVAALERALADVRLDLAAVSQQLSTLLRRQATGDVNESEKSSDGAN